MHKTIIMVFALLAGLLGTVATAAPALASAAAAPPAACSAQWTAEAFYAKAEGHWITDCGTKGRIHIKCSNLQGTFYGSGGWVTSHVNDAKYCPSSMTLAKAAWQTWNGEPGFPVCTYWFWPTRSQHCSGGGKPVTSTYFHGVPAGRGVPVTVMHYHGRPVPGVSSL